MTGAVLDNGIGLHHINTCHCEAFFAEAIHPKNK